MKKILLLAIAVFSFSSIARADGFTVFSTRADQNPTDIIDWNQLGPSGTSPHHSPVGVHIQRESCPGRKLWLNKL